MGTEEKKEKRKRERRFEGGWMKKRRWWFTVTDLIKSSGRRQGTGSQALSVLLYPAACLLLLC